VQPPGSATAATWMVTLVSGSGLWWVWSGRGVMRSRSLPCYELVQQGVLPSLQLGRRRLIPRAALERYVQEQARPLVELAGGLEPPT
jgi:Helix-turn-helix domain